MTIEISSQPPGPRPSLTPGARLASVYPQKMSTVKVKRQTLEATPRKALVFLYAAGTCKPIRAALETMGYTRAEHYRGWALLLRVSGYEAAVVDEPVSDDDVIKAQGEVEAWSEAKIQLADVSLKHRHPAQHAFVFEKLKRAKGPEAVLAVNTFLTRLDALEKGVGREETHADDLAALATLAQRGLTADERRRVRALLATARGFTSADEEAAPKSPAVSTTERDLYELRAFYEEWTGVARLVLTRRDHLIRCGLAKRRMKSADEVDASDEDDEGEDATDAVVEAREGEAPPAPTPGEVTRDGAGADPLVTAAPVRPAAVTTKAPTTRAAKATKRARARRKR